ncbi:unnamed protein product [Rhodiola kirilowii]
MENCEQAKCYIKSHKTDIDREFPNCPKYIRIKHFLPYFQKWMEILEKEGHPDYNPMIHHLASQPQSHTCYSQCDVNGVKFVIKERDRKLKTQKSGVMVRTEGDEIFYGILEEVVELKYPEGMPVIVFKCRWFNTDPTERGNVKIDHGLISVDTSTSWYEDIPFCVASTARQVFYIDDPKSGDNWKIVNTISQRGTYNCSSVALDENNLHSYMLSQAENAYQEHSSAKLPQVPIDSIHIDLGFLPQMHDKCGIPILYQ